MTVHMHKFGKYLVTRVDAKRVLQAIDSSMDSLVLDFSGVEVANHSFADELGKGLLETFSTPDLSGVEVKGTNAYVDNCVQAGFCTASVQ